MRKFPFTLALLPGLAFVGEIEVYEIEGERALVARWARPANDVRAPRERKLMMLSLCEIAGLTGASVVSLRGAA